MKNLLFLLVVVASTHSIPVDPADEVELVEPVNTNEGDPELIPSGGGVPDGFPILVITTRARRPSFGGFPFLNPSSFFGDNDQFDQLFPEDDDDENLPEIPADSLFPGGLGSIFGSSDSEGPCGLLCKVFKNLETHIRELEDEVKEVRDKQRDQANEIGGDGAEDSDDEGPKTVYEEKVLDDGRVVKINKTTFSDTNDDGTSFFSFSSTSFVSDGDEDSDDGDKVDADDTDDADNANDPESDVEIIDTSRDITIIPSEKFEEENVERQRRSPARFDQRQQQQQQQQWDDVQFDEPPPKKDKKKRKKFNRFYPTYNLPINMEDDTRVNEIISEHASRGGLVFLDPDSELVESRRD